MCRLPAEGPDAAEELAAAVSQEQDGRRTLQRQQRLEVVPIAPGGLREGEPQRLEAEVCPWRGGRGQAPHGQPLAPFPLDRRDQEADPAIRRQRTALAA